MKPSDYLRPELTPGGDPFIGTSEDDQGVVHLLDAASIQWVAEAERRDGSFSMGVEWVVKAAAQFGIELPPKGKRLVLWEFPWTSSLQDPDGNDGRHTVLQGILKEYLTNRAVRELGPYIDKLAVSLVRLSVEEQLASGAQGLGVFNIAKFSNELAFHVISELAGFPHMPRDVAFMLGHLTEIAHRKDFIDAFRPAADEVGEYIERIVIEHSKAGKGGLLGYIIDAYAADKIDLHERNGLILGLWSAGHDTTATMTSLMFGLLDEFGLAKTAAANLSGEDGKAWRQKAMREAGRFTPFPYNPTVATREVTLPNGFVVPALSTVRLHWAAANRNPGVFERPDEFWLERPAGPNFAFGHGLHYCLGKSLALYEVDAAMRAVYGSLPGLRLTAWNRRKQLIDVIDVADVTYDLAGAARLLGL